MATKKNEDAAPADDAGQAEIQKKFDEAAEKGYFGTTPPGPANEEYSLETGPDSPSAYDVTRAAKEKRDA